MRNLAECSLPVECLLALVGSIATTKNNVYKLRVEQQKTTIIKNKSSKFLNLKTNRWVKFSIGFSFDRFFVVRRDGLIVDGNG